MMFACDTDRGACLVSADNEENVRIYLTEAYGYTLQINEISTDKDKIAWAEAMGACVHDIET